MAWFAEMKRRKWYCICQRNLITWYSNKLYKEWLDSLTPEQKERLEEYRRKKKEKDTEARQALYNLLSFGVALGNAYCGRYW